MDLNNVEQELDELLKKRESLVSSLKTLENQIYRFEGNYLEETSQYGNIIKGWDKNNVRLSYKVTPNSHGYRKFKESDRLFSMSSATFKKSIEEDVKDNEGGVNGANSSNNEIAKDHRYLPQYKFDRNVSLSRKQS